MRWQESVECLVREGVTTFVELGPGTVLSGLVRKIAKGARVLNVDAPESLEAERHDLGVPIRAGGERLGPGTWVAGDVPDAEHRRKD